MNARSLGVAGKLGRYTARWVLPGVLDLTPLEGLPVAADHILAVGWLEPPSEFPTGATPSEVYERLQEFARKPWQPFVTLGVHSCSLCQFAGEKSGTANFYIPYRGQIFVCPELIVHYINAHHYKPPAEFCEAVLACPAMDSMEYKRLLVQCNGSALGQVPAE